MMHVFGKKKNDTPRVSRSQGVSEIMDVGPLYAMVYEYDSNTSKGVALSFTILELGMEDTVCEWQHRQWRVEGADTDRVLDILNGWAASIDRMIDANAAVNTFSREIWPTEQKPFPNTELFSAITGYNRCLENWYNQAWQLWYDVGVGYILPDTGTDEMVDVSGFAVRSPRAPRVPPGLE